MVLNTINKVSMVSNHSIIRKVYRIIERSDKPMNIKTICTKVNYCRHVVENVVLLLIYLGVVKHIVHKGPESNLYILNKNAEVFF